MTGYVYAIQPDELDLVKVGHTADLAARLKQLSGQTPHLLHPRLVLDVGCFHRARIYESFILSWLGPWVSHGEWITSMDAVRDVFSNIAPAIDVTNDFSAYEHGRRRNRREVALSIEELEARLPEPTAGSGWKVRDCRFSPSNPIYQHHVSPAA